MARPTKYSATRNRVLFQALRMGLPRKYAAGIAGICPDTFYEWLKIKPGFSDFVTRAECLFVVDCMQTISDAAATNWRAAAWLLERRVPDEFGKGRKVDVISEEQIEKAIAELIENIRISNERESIHASK